MSNQKWKQPQLDPVEEVSFLRKKLSETREAGKDSIARSSRSS